MTALTFSHIAIACKDALAIEHFYTKYFDFKSARVIPLGGTQIVFIKSGMPTSSFSRRGNKHPSHRPVRTGRGILAGVTSLLR